MLGLLWGHLFDHLLRSVFQSSLHITYDKLPAGPLRAASMYCVHLLSYDLWALLRLLSLCFVLESHTSMSDSHPFVLSGGPPSWSPCSVMPLLGWCGTSGLKPCGREGSDLGVFSFEKLVPHYADNPKISPIYVARTKEELFFPTRIWTMVPWKWKPVCPQSASLTPWLLLPCIKTKTEKTWVRICGRCPDVENVYFC